jgi:hypothetical protein
MRASPAVCTFSAHRRVKRGGPPLGGWERHVFSVSSTGLVSYADP